MKINKFFALLVGCCMLVLMGSCSKDNDSIATDDMNITDDMDGTDDGAGDDGGDDSIISCALSLSIDNGGPASNHYIKAEHTAVTDYDPFPISYNWQPISIDGVDTAGTADYSPRLIGPDRSLYRSPLPGYYDCATTDAEGCTSVQRILYHGYYIETNEVSVNGATRYPWVANDFKNLGALFVIGSLKDFVEPEGSDNLSIHYQVNDDNPIAWKTGVYDLSAPGNPISLIYQKHIDGSSIPAIYMDRSEGFVQILFTRDEDFDDENQSENQLFQVKFTFFDVQLNDFGDPDFILNNSIDVKWI